MSFELERIHMHTTGMHSIEALWRHSAKPEGRAFNLGPCQAAHPLPEKGTAMLSGFRQMETIHF